MPEKSYSRCIECEHIGKKCGGPDFVVMEAQKLSDWCRKRKEFLHKSDPKWTNTYVSQQTEVSLATVSRFFSGDIDDIKLSTAARIIRLLVNGTWGQYPCVMFGNEAADPAAEVECRHLREQLTSERDKSAYLKEQVAFKEQQMLAKDKQISECSTLLQKSSRTNKALSVLLGACCALMIGILFFV